MRKIQTLTTVFSYKEFQHNAYSVRLFSGTKFINASNGRFCYIDDLQHVLAEASAYEKAKTVQNLQGEVIAKRSAPDLPLKNVRYKKR